METVADFIFLGCKITADSDYSHEIKTLATWKERYDKPLQCIKKPSHSLANKGQYSQSYGFSSSHVQMLGKIEDKRRRGHQRMRWLDDITDAMDMNLAHFGRW